MNAPVIIVGGGLAGSLAALALTRRRPDVDLLLIEPGEALGGNHVWSFFDSDLDVDGRALVADMVTQHWPAHEIRFPRRRRRLGFGYNSIRSADLDRVVRAALPPERIVRAAVADLAADAVTLGDGRRIAASAVIDARGPTDFSGLALGWQKFVGRVYRTAAPHGVDDPIIMDATVAQDDGYRFVYTLPFAPTELMIEDTYYSDTPTLDTAGIGAKVDAYAAANLTVPHEMVHEETGVLPVVLGGRVESLWPEGPAVARLGLRGGFFHPTTGYSLPDAVANALLLAGQSDLSGQALHDLYRARAVRLWRTRGFFRLLNRMLFRAAAEDRRYRVLEHFYRLPEALVGRFYAAKLTRLDKLRIVSGRPPVPLMRALSAALGKAA